MLGGVASAVAAAYHQPCKREKFAFFESSDLYWNLPESGELWYKKKDPKKAF